MSQGAESFRTTDIASGRWLTPLELTLLGAIWGASFLFMRVSAEAFGPVALVEVRLAAGALVLMPFLWRERARMTFTSANLLAYATNLIYA